MAAVFAMDGVAYIPEMDCTTALLHCTEPWPDVQIVSTVGSGNALAKQENHN